LGCSIRSHACISLSRGLIALDASALSTAHQAGFGVMPETAVCLLLKQISQNTHVWWVKYGRKSPNSHLGTSSA
jgi:hypothetical protein